ncbi:MAG: hypothetical protein IPN72_14510 [Saprospiraceae bacterium]|nr:hypothetical protein [Saprospiraceae bacterium]
MYDNYQVSPLKTDNARQGVNTLDLLHIQRHILKIKELENPFKLIVADANFDQKITVSDLVDIRKVVLEVTASSQPTILEVCKKRIYIL